MSVYLSIERRMRKIGKRIEWLTTAIDDLKENGHDCGVAKTLLENDFETLQDEYDWLEGLVINGSR